MASDGTGKARVSDAPTSSVPMKAMAMPTEQITRYFQVASNDSRERCRPMRKVVTSVVDSMPTHMSPRWLDRNTRVMAASEPNHRAPKRRAVRRSIACELQRK